MRAGALTPSIAVVGVSMVGSLVLAALLSVAEPDPWFGEDKAKHFGVSAGLGVAGTSLSPLVTDSLPLQLTLAGGMSLSIGLGKEIADSMGGSGFSVRDLAWDAAGTMTGMLVVWAVDKLF